MDDTTELREIFEQVDFCLSLRFKEKYRHKYGSHFIQLFQEKIMASLKSGKPLTRKLLIETFTKKHSYNQSLLEEFFEDIDLHLYYPIILE